MAISTAALVQEFATRARALGLKADVLGAGNVNAQIAVVGEAPGDRELSLKQPFVGGSGQHLWNALRKYGITRQQVWATNVVKRQLAFGRDIEKAGLPANELEHWEGLLRWELSQLRNLKYVLVLGNHALAALTGERGITNWRGSVLELDGLTHIVTFNPAMVLREPKWEVVFAFDIAKLDRVLKGKFTHYEIKPIINPSYTEALQWIDKLRDERLPVSFDIEIISRETACVGLANDNHTGMCISFRDRTSDTYSLREERDIRHNLQALFADTRCQFVAQNGSFDCSWLWYKDRIKVHRVWFDTLLAHHTLYPSLPHSLGFLTSQYTDHPYYKDEKGAWKEGSHIDTFWEYNVKDCCITRKASERLHEELRAQHLDKFFFDHVMRIQPHLVKMCVMGIKMDTALKHHISDMLNADVARIEEEFCEAVHVATGDTVYYPNPRSPSQLRELFFHRLRLVGRGDSTDSDNRARMARHPKTTPEARRVLTLLDSYAEENKFRGTYADMLVDGDGRVRSEYKQYGTQSAPGRLSSAAPMWGGTNLQNQSVRSKPMFVADDDTVFLYFDLSQAEARVVSEIWNVTGLQENFALAREKGVDVHRANAARIFRVPIDDIPSIDFHELHKSTDDPALVGKATRRYLGKRCVHGLNYRMGPQKLADVCNIPYAQADEAYQAYHRAFPQIKAGWDETLRTVNRDRQLFSPLGRRLIFLGRLPHQSAGEGSDDANVLDSIIAFVPQSTIGDKVSACIADIQEDPEWPLDDARVVLNIHDALIAQVRCDHDLVRHCAGIMKKHAEAPIYIKAKTLVIPAELAMSVPVEWRVDHDELTGIAKHIEYYKSPEGRHRWSVLEKFKLSH